MKPFRSIKWQLQIWQMLLLAGVLGTLLPLHYHLRKKELIAQLDKDLQNALVLALPVVAPLQPGGIGRPPRPNEAGVPERPRRNHPLKSGTDYLNSIAESSYYIATWNSDGSQKERYGNVPDSLSFSVINPPAKGNRHLVTRNGYRELIQQQPTKFLIVVGHPLDDIYATLAATRRQLLLVGSAVWLIGFFGGLLIIGKTMKPINEISRTAEQIAAGDRSRRIELSDAPDELAGMAQTLNETFDHLDEAIETQKRFSTDASHELRTPIAVVIAQTQAALKRERTAEEYQTILEACLRAGQRMKTMANSLLTLTRIDSRGNNLEKARHDLNLILSDAVDSASLLSTKHPIDFYGWNEPLYANVDRDRIHQIITNLLANAVQHNPEGCALHVSLRKKNGTAVIDLADEGIGIDEEHLPHIFERFYRVDKSRSREHGGAGLGLSIVKSLVEAHGGTINARSESARGTTFTIALDITTALP